MKKGLFRCFKAFSLVEVFISIVIFTFIIAGVFAVFYLANTISQLDLGRMDLAQPIRQAMQGMVRELRQSAHSDVVLSQNGQRIDFVIRNFSSIPEIVYPISYYLNASGQLIRENPSGQQKILANQISTLCFCWDSVTGECGVNCSSSFRLRLEAAKLTGQKTLLFSLIEKVRLRNY